MILLLIIDLTYFIPIFYDTGGSRLNDTLTPNKALSNRTVTNTNYIVILTAWFTYVTNLNDVIKSIYHRIY